MSCEPADRLLQTLIVRIPGATHDLLSLEVFNAVDEFFRRTSAWRYETDIQLDVTQVEYDMSLPADSQFVRMHAITLQGQPVIAAAAPGTVSSSFGVLTPETTFVDGDAEFSPITIGESSPGVLTYAVFRPTYITLAPAPSPEQVQFPLKMIMALSIARTCADKDCNDWGMPDWVMDMFFQEFLDGALGRVYNMPNKPWSDATKAGYHLRRFRNGMAYRKQEANKGFVYGVPGWRFPRQGGWVR